jgi:hypothetical protein
MTPVICVVQKSYEGHLLGQLMGCKLFTYFEVSMHLLFV